MLIPFIKMHGLQNDFVILTEYIVLSPEYVSFLCDRNKGIGADQLVVCRKFIEKNHPLVEMKIFNRDGTSAGACGNATRCVAKFFMEKLHLQEIEIVINKQKLMCKREENNSITVKMGKPFLDYKHIPIKNDINTKKITTTQMGLKNQLPQNFPTGFAARFGNPHVVFFFKSIDFVDVTNFGMLIEHSDLFIEKTNVEFAEVISDTEIKLRVWERGTGITKACGSGACATFVAARTLGLIKNNYCDIILEGGKLYISSDKNGDIYMNGEATFVFSGSIEIKDV